MKKKIFLFFILFFALFGSFILKEYTNPKIVRVENTKLGTYTLSKYIFGKKNGLEQIFSIDNTLLLETLYKNDKKIKSKVYFNNVIVRENKYKDETLINSKFYSISRQLQTEVLNYTEPVSSDIEITYYTDMYDFKTPVTNYIYYPDGKLYIKSKHNQDNITLKIEVYHPNGKILAIDTFNYETKVATFKLFDEEGNIQKENQINDSYWEGFFMDYTSPSMYFNLEKKVLLNFLSGDIYKL